MHLLQDILRGNIRPTVTREMWSLNFLRHKDLTGFK